MFAPGKGKGKKYHSLAGHRFPQFGLGQIGPFPRSVRRAGPCRDRRPAGPCDRLHGGRAGGLAHHRRGRLHADRAVDLHVAGVAASGHPKVAPALGHQNAVGNAVTLARLEAAELREFLVVTLVLGFGVVVDVDVDGVVEDGDLIGKLPPGRRSRRSSARTRRRSAAIRARPPGCP